MFVFTEKDWETFNKFTEKEWETFNKLVAKVENKYYNFNQAPLPVPDKKTENIDQKLGEAVIDLQEANRQLKIYIGTLESENRALKTVINNYEKLIRP